MRLRGTSTFGLALACAACGASPEPQATAPTPAPSLGSAAVPAKRKADPYYLITSRRSVSNDATTPNLRYAIVDGVRVLTQNAKLERALTTTEPPLVDVAKVPDHLGGGYLFWNQRALYRAQTFTGELSGLADVGARPSRVAFGPDFALLVTPHGHRVLDPKTGAGKASGPAGMIDAAALADGRAVALTAVGDVLVSSDAGKRWSSVRGRLKGPVRGLREHDGDLWIVERSGEALRYEPGGRLTRRSAPKPPSSKLHTDPRWTLPTTPLEAAAEAGVRSDDTRALLALNGAVVTIDLQSGELLSFSRALLPSASECRLLPTSAELLMVCARPALTVVRDPLGAARVERSFEPGTPVAFAESMLTFGAGCDGVREAGRVCLRAPNGEYRAYDRRTEIAGLVEPGASAKGAGPELAVEWVPKQGGGAVGIVSRPHAALVDAASGALVPIAKQRADAWLSALAVPASAPVTTSRLARSDGRIVGYGRDRSFSVAPDGRLELGAFEFASLQSFAGRALALDRSQRTFESSDYGVTWREVAGPPSRAAAQACSDVGCRSEGWLRLGWGPVPPEPVVTPRVVPAPPLHDGPELPTLDCREQQLPSLRTRRLSAAFGEDETTFDFGLGARQLLMSRGQTEHYRQLYPALRSSGYGLWALLYARVPAVENTSDGPVPASQAELLREKSITFTRPFDPKARVTTARLSWKAQAAAAMRVGGDLPSLQVDDQEEQIALPVSAAPPLFSDGLLLKEQYGPGIWVRDGEGAPRPISLGQGRDALDLIDAATHGGGELTLLLIDELEQSRVLRVSGTRLEEVFEFPARASALAIAAGGEPGLFFTTASGDPPTQQQPAWLVRPGAAPLELPSWSTSKPASAPECAPSAADQRVLIHAPRSWLKLGSTANPWSAADPHFQMLALVRVSAVRYCLEAVELTAADVTAGEITIPTRVVARFSGEPAAARVGAALGAEFRQALRCELR